MSPARMHTTGSYVLPGEMARSLYSRSGCCFRLCTCRFFLAAGYGWIYAEMRRTAVYYAAWLQSMRPACHTINDLLPERHSGCWFRVTDVNRCKALTSQDVGLRCPQHAAPRSTGPQLNSFLSPAAILIQRSWYSRGTGTLSGRKVLVIWEGARALGRRRGCQRRWWSVFVLMRWSLRWGMRRKCCSCVGL